MSQGHGPSQSASPLTVSKVAGDQSHASVAALVLCKSNGSAPVWKAAGSAQFCVILISSAYSRVFWLAEKLLSDTIQTRIS